ncbi:unnamed protein product [Cylicocyclus nassatus]|uniref:Uncharacterized protein n=1 Tax=Cylicocyclus nassatus TaxID=53992 RepID=A0AA36HBD4_CYLNA|nr:unnamed protein product [Cylicocyclus nassatus]
MTDHIVDGCGDHVSALDTEPPAMEPILDDGENFMQGVEEYFYELLIDMDMVSRIRRTNPTQIQAGQMVLSREILRVWDLIVKRDPRILGTI